MFSWIKTNLKITSNYTNLSDGLEQFVCVNGWICCFIRFSLYHCTHHLLFEESQEASQSSLKSNQINIKIQHLYTRLELISNENQFYRIGILFTLEKSIPPELLEQNRLFSAMWDSSVVLYMTCKLCAVCDTDFQTNYLLKAWFSIFAYLCRKFYIPKHKIYANYGQYWRENWTEFAGIDV